MRRITIVLAVLLLAGAAFTAWGAASPGGNSAAAGPAAKAKKKKPAAKPKLPPLPSAVKNRKRWEIGIKCDFPPFGFIDVRGRNDGYDVQVARRFAQLAFGNKTKVNLTCVTTPSRIPTLISGRVDIIVSTLTWTQARADQIDFSIPYYSATGRLLVPNNSSLTMNSLGGKTVVTTRGALYATWVRNCFKSAKLLEVDSPALATSAVKDGRADTFMFDDAFLLGVATQDRDVRLTGRQVPQRPVGHRHPQGRRCDGPLGQRSAALHEEAGRVREDPPGKRASAPGRELPRQRSPAEEHLRVSGRQGRYVDLSLS